MTNTAGTGDRFSGDCNHGYQCHPFSTGDFKNEKQMFLIPFASCQSQTCAPAAHVLPCSCCCGFIPPLVFHSTSSDWFSLFLDASTQLRTTALSYITCLFPPQKKPSQSVRKREVLLLAALNVSRVTWLGCPAACLASAGGC